jgi:phosphate uptake regulator
VSHLTDMTRADSVAKLRQAADLLEQGDEKSAGQLILAGLAPVARDLRRIYGPMVKILVGSWVRKILDEA